VNAQRVAVGWSDWLGALPLLGLGVIVWIRIVNYARPNRENTLAVDVKGDGVDTVSDVYGLVGEVVRRRAVGRVASLGLRTLLSIY
jgi:hypothetical protein